MYGGDICLFDHRFVKEARTIDLKREIKECEKVSCVKRGVICR